NAIAPNKRSATSTTSKRSTTPCCSAATFRSTCWPKTWTSTFERRKRELYENTSFRTQSRKSHAEAQSTQRKKKRIGRHKSVHPEPVEGFFSSGRKNSRTRSPSTGSG